MTSEPKPSEDRRFEELGDRPQASLAAELLAFLLQNKKWWLLPILVMMGLLGLLIIAGGTGFAPFIYTLF